MEGITKEQQAVIDAAKEYAKRENDNIRATLLAILERSVKDLEREEQLVYIRCKFPGTTKMYAYKAPRYTRVGDVVKTPSSANGTAFAEVVEYGKGLYDGPTKTVVNVYTKVSQ